LPNVNDGGIAPNPLRRGTLAASAPVTFDTAAVPASLSLNGFSLG
jgi:hypothetical protein